MTIRSIDIKDYDELFNFWESYYVVTPLDESERFKMFLEKNPGLSVLAENNGSIIGTALGSFDGRRGYLQKIVVSKDFRKQGVGQQLVKGVVERLEDVGAIDIRLNCAEELIHFYETCGFKSTIKPLLTIKMF